MAAAARVRSATARTHCRAKPRVPCARRAPSADDGSGAHSNGKRTSRSSPPRLTWRPSSRLATDAGRKVPSASERHTCSGGLMVTSTLAPDPGSGCSCTSSSAMPHAAPTLGKREASADAAAELAQPVSGTSPTETGRRRGPPSGGRPKASAQPAGHVGQKRPPPPRTGGPRGRRHRQQVLTRAPRPRSSASRSTPSPSSPPRSRHGAAPPRRPLIRLARAAAVGRLPRRLGDRRAHSATLPPPSAARRGRAPAGGPGQRRPVAIITAVGARPVARARRSARRRRRPRRRRPPRTASTPKPAPLDDARAALGGPSPRARRRSPSAARTMAVAAESARSRACPLNDDASRTRRRRPP